MPVRDAASQIVDAAGVCLIAFVVIPGFVVAKASQGVWSQKSATSFRDAFDYTFPVLAAIELVIGVVFVTAQFSNMRIVSRVHPAWGAYAAFLGLSFVALIIVALATHRREWRRGYDILDASEKTANAAAAYRRTVMAEAKALGVWLVAGGFAVLWLEQIARGAI